MAPRISFCIFGLLILLAIAVYEMIAYWKWGLGGTITYVVRELYAEYPLIAPIIAMAMGILFRHLFPPALPPGPPPPSGPT